MDLPGLQRALATRFARPVELFIDGQFVAASNDEPIEVTNPATGQRVAEVHAASAADVDRAVAAARRALQAPSWRDMAPSRRERLLWEIAEGLSGRADELGLTETLNNGKTLKEGIGDIEAAADVFRFYAGCVRQLGGETLPVDSPDFVYTLREPIGVCGQIVPWNYPLLMASWKVAPALAAGCTVVLKPSEWTPLTALGLAEVCAQVELPDGVLNVVPGYGAVTGAAIAQHMDVDKLAFTGSTRTGRTLLQAAGASNLKRVSLELGGKSPILAFPDADLDQVVEAAFWGIFANKGEVCSASSRLIAHRDIRPELAKRLAKRASEMRVGDPLDPRNEMGALVSQPQFDKVMDYVERGKRQGAKLLSGGKRLTDGALAKGLFVAPTVFDEVSAEMDIAREEIFGPVLSILEFETEDEALQLANGTDYGLVSGVFTRDVSRAHRVARRLDAGVVWINRWNGFDCAVPFGGVKHSGFGRDLGRHALEQYTRTKSVWVR